MEKEKKYKNWGSLEFEVEYLNGIIWNRKKYDYAHNLIEEIREGKGFIEETFSSTLTCNSGYHIFKGEIINGKKNGKWKECYKDGYNNVEDLYFEGEYKNGKRNGKGKEYFYNNIIFEGEYLYDYRKKGKYM